MSRTLSYRKARANRFSVEVVQQCALSGRAQAEPYLRLWRRALAIAALDLISSGHSRHYFHGRFRLFSEAQRTQWASDAYARITHSSHVLGVDAEWARERAKRLLETFE